MARFWDVLFSGSRFIFWTLAPLLLVCAIFITLLEDAWTLQNTTTVLAFDAIAALFLAYLASLVEEVSLGKKHFTLAEFEAGPFNAIHGFLIIGLPCLYLTLRGSFSRHNGPKETDDSQPY